MTPSKTLPTEPGLYRWHDGRGKVKEICVYPSIIGQLQAIEPEDPRHPQAVSDFTGGYWERIDLGEPFIAPEPPVVELWEGTSTLNRPEHLFIVRSGERVIAHSDDGQSYGYCNWNDANTHYTNLRKVGNLVLEEE